MSVVMSLCFVVAEKSAAIYAAMAGSKYFAKFGDVKGREHILCKDWRRKRKGKNTGDVEPRRRLLEMCSFACLCSL